MMMIATYRCLLMSATPFDEFSGIILPLLICRLPLAPPLETASGNPDAQQDRAEGKLVPSISTLFQSMPLLVITSWLIQAGAKTAFGKSISDRDALNFEPSLWISDHFHSLRLVSEVANWSANS